MYNNVCRRIVSCCFITCLDGSTTMCCVLLTCSFNMVLVSTYRDLDEAALSQARISNPTLTNMKPTTPGYPLINRGFLRALKNQLVHLENGCCSDSLDHLPFTQQDTVKYHSSEHDIAVWKSLRGTSKVEAMHSVMHKGFYMYNNINPLVYDARLFWMIT